MQFANPAAALPFDAFVIAAQEPAAIMREYAKITGYPEMAPLWSFGYQQSHRTLGAPEEILQEAKTFREKKLPCDAMIYLGTDFCPERLEHAQRRIYVERQSVSRSRRRPSRNCTTSISRWCCTS